MTNMKKSKTISMPLALFMALSAVSAVSADGSDPSTDPMVDPTGTVMASRTRKSRAKERT